MNNTNFLKKRIIAHRGFFNNENGIPENSIPAFERAVKNNYSIELDIHLLEDGNIVVFHDDNLKRMTGIDKKIKECTYDEIKDLKLNNTKYNIPLLIDVLKLVQGKVPLLIEIKYDRKVGETEKLMMKIMEKYDGEYAVQSFNPSSVLWFKKNYPEVIRGQLSGSFKNDNMFILKKYVLKNLFLNFLTVPDFVSYSINDLPNKFVEKFKKKEKLVLVWTVRNKENYEKSKKYADNIIGENFDKYII